MTFCQIFEVASRVRQKVVDHRSLTIEKLSVQEKKVVGDKRSFVAGSLMTGSTVFCRGHWNGLIALPVTDTMSVTY